MRYSKELKDSIITKMLPPNNQSLSLISAGDRRPRRDIEVVAEGN